MTKITLVGAGSVVFTKTLVCDILQYAALADCTICLMDINPRPLTVIEKLVRRIVSQLGVKAKVESTTDLRTACRGAKFVITTIQVGGYKPSTVVDFEIPAKYGVQQTIADTLGVGGVFRALRSIPELVKVARTIQEVGAPDPVMLNYTNPMAMNMWAIDRVTGIASVGLCHSVQGTSRQLATYCGFDPKDVSYLVAGINHMAFFLKFEYRGKDAYPYLFEALENPAVFACDRVRFEMMRRLGYFVTESSEHQSEYNPYFIHHGKEVQEQFGVPINEYIRRCESMVGRWDKVEEELLDEKKEVPINRSVEYGSTIVHSIVSGESSVVYGNVPNTGLISNIRQGASVEVPCLVNKQGIQPTHIGALPPQLAAIIATNVNVQELTVEAAITGQREYIYQAVMHDPHTATVLTLDKIWAMCDELIEAHQRDGYLGEFKPVAPNTGKPASALERIFFTIEPEEAPFVASPVESRFALVARNASKEAFEGEVTLNEAGSHLTFSSPTITVKVAAGETIRISFTAQKQPGSEGKELELSVGSSSIRTLERTLRLPVRNQIALPVNGTEPHRFNVEWSGNTVAEGTLALTDTTLILEAEVDDTDLRTAPFFPDGSSIEIGLKDARSQATQVWSIIVLPDEAGTRLISKADFSGSEPYEGGTACTQRLASGYKVRVELDLAKAGVSADSPFLLEMGYHVNALGTAHGKVYASWQGSGHMRENQSRFALISPQKA